MVTAFFPPFIGGTEIQADRLSKALARMGIGVTVITQRFLGQPVREDRDGIRVYRLWRMGRGRVSSFLYLCSGFLFLLRRRRQFDILHAHMTAVPAVLAGAARLFLGMPAVVKVSGARATGDMATASRSGAGRLKLAAIRRWLDGYIAPSAEVAEELRAHGFPAGRTVCIPNGVDTARFRPPSDAAEKQGLRTRFGWPGGLIVIFVGRLEPGKGTETLLEAWAGSFPGPEDRLVFQGDGRLREALMARALVLGIADRVEWAGDRADVAERLRAADVFALPSAGEGLSNALLEALSTGSAVVTTPVGGAAEVITDGRQGFLVPSSDDVALAGALRRLREDPALRARLGAAARERIEEAYSVAKTAAAHKAFYQSLAPARP